MVYHGSTTVYVYRGVYCGVWARPAGFTCTCVQVTCIGYGIAGDRYGVTKSHLRCDPCYTLFTSPPTVANNPWDVLNACLWLLSFLFLCLPLLPFLFSVWPCGRFYFLFLDHLWSPPFLFDRLHSRLYFPSQTCSLYTGGRCLALSSVPTLFSLELLLVSCKAEHSRPYSLSDHIHQSSV